MNRLLLVIDFQAGATRIVGPFETKADAATWYRHHQFDKRVDVIGGHFVQPIDPADPQAFR